MATPMAHSPVRRRWLTATLAAGTCACALAGAAWVYADQHPATTPPPETTAAPKAAVPAVPGSTKNSPWHKLTRAQQTALQPLAGEWDRLDAPRRQKWLDIANRYASMKPGEQARVQDRMRDWVKLTPEQRRNVRENYTRSKRIDPGQKSAQWQQYQQLSDEEKQKLATEAAAKKPLNRIPAVDSSTRKLPLSLPTPPAPPAASVPTTVPAPAPVTGPTTPVSTTTNTPISAPALTPPASNNAN